MIELLIIADDLSGALDTGVEFSSNGINTHVMVGTHMKEYALANQDITVLVVDAETRHLTPEQAYQNVFDVVTDAKELGIRNIYKKTDSVLRGNVGAELTAALDAAGEDQLHFVPAFPKHNRYTIDGVHYINKVPVAQSVFAQDPFEPVRHSKICEIIGEKTDTPVTIAEAEAVDTQTKGIIAYNVKSAEEMEQIAEGLCKAGKQSLIAGCGGLAGAIWGKLNLAENEKKFHAPLMGGMLVVCGSVNPITLSQLRVAESNGYIRLRLSPLQKLGEGNQLSLEPFWKEWNEASRESQYVIIDANDAEDKEKSLRYAEERGISLAQVRERITRTMGRISKQILNEGCPYTLFLTGGDTVLGFMREIQVEALIPICEIVPGAILSQFQYEGKYYQIITKSGGFGDEDLLLILKDYIRNGDAKTS